MRVRGGAEARFGPVVDAFRANFVERGETGAACCVYVDGTPVVDVQGGTTRSGAPYDERTVQVVFSVTKAITTIATLAVADAGLIDLDAPVGRYWPELGNGEATRLTVRALMAHRAGLPAYDEALSRADVCARRRVIEALERQAPYWRPDSEHGYHAVTFGFLVDEIVRRATGRTVSAVVTELAAQLGGADLWIGFPTAQHHRLAPAELLARPVPPEAIERLRAFAPGTLAGRALTLDGALPLGPDEIAYNEPAVLTSHLPGSGGVASARSLARLFAATIGPVDGVRLISAEVLDAATKPLSSGTDRILGVETRFGTGFMLPGPELPLLTPHSFGHPGAGGSLAMADPELGASLAYTTVAMGPHLVSDPRATALVDAVRRCLR